MSRSHTSIRSSLAPLGLAIALGCGNGPTDGAGPLRTFSHIERHSPALQFVQVGQPVNHPPTVRALDDQGLALPGVEVAFGAPGGATTMVTTDASGLARWDGWIAPSVVGATRVEVHAGTAPPITFDAEVAERGFEVTFRTLGTVPNGGAEAIAAAKEKIERVVFADLPDEAIALTACSVNGQPPIEVNETIDDILVLVRFRAIDGLGGAGATGNPCLIRDDRGQTLVGIIELDVAEWARLTSTLRRDFILHELIHVMGFVPNLLNRTLPSGHVRHCLDLPSTGAPNRVVQDTHFSCPFARSAFQQVGGTDYAGATVPLENGATVATLGSGTLNHHWRKAVFGEELMTGWFTTSAGAPLSKATLGMLEDMGYGVVMGAADPWSAQSPGSTGFP